MPSSIEGSQVCEEAGMLHRELRTGESKSLLIAQSIDYPVGLRLSDVLAGERLRGSIGPEVLGEVIKRLHLPRLPLPDGCTPPVCMVRQGLDQYPARGWSKHGSIFLSPGLRKIDPTCCSIAYSRRRSRVSLDV
jgi:hypothetical protein